MVVVSLNAVAANHMVEQGKGRPMKGGDQVICTISPLKHTVDVPPMGITIEFEADEEKDWFFYCHNLYHMKTGMSRVVSDEGNELDKDIAKKLSWDNKWFSKGEVTGASNYSGTDVAVFNT